MQLLGHPGLTTGVLCNSAVFALGYKVLRKGLTPLGVARAFWFLGTSIFPAFGLGGYVLVCLDLIFGTLVRHPAVQGCILWFLRLERGKGLCHSFATSWYLLPCLLSFHAVISPWSGTYGIYVRLFVRRASLKHVDACT
ncbi:hypothetical protein Vretifemale_17875 [Volvox reticuliferus]|uniref:Uncharacterized protein n=1 Tax=Volvox reticuliferus TaxID=1737510 RepID=A0A8J4CZY8_9CHLO|nr:hypothetical protein Vretifemale_17875 [Volvox reticuliferus]